MNKIKKRNNVDAENDEDDNDNDDGDDVSDESTPTLLPKRHLTTITSVDNRGRVKTPQTMVQVLTNLARSSSNQLTTVFFQPGVREKSKG